VRVAVCPGFKVTGVVIPFAPKSEPATESEEIVTGAVPEEVTVTDCVPVLPTETLPNDTDVVFRVKVGVAAFSCSETVLEVPAVVAVRVTDCALVTEVALAVKVALVAAAGTATEAGTLTELLLLARLTLRPPLGAGADKLTVHASARDPVMEVLPQKTALTVGVTAAMPAPLRLIVAVDVLLVIVAVPV
jgi:hypothetical protein